MPAETGEDHAHIDPGSTDTTYCLPTGRTHSKEGPWLTEGVVEIETVEGVVEVLVPCPLGGCKGEATAVTISRQISSVLHC